MEEKKDYFIIGKVLKPFGINGEIKVQPITDNIKRFKKIPFVYLRKVDRYIKIPVKSSKKTKRGLIYILPYISLKNLMAYLSLILAI